MRKKFLIIVLLVAFILLPSDVFAEDYTFEIGEGKEWNESNILELYDLLEEYEYQDYSSDHIFNNKYVFNFADGDYDFGDYPLAPNGISEYNFGVGNYNLAHFDNSFGITKVSGQGINKTHLYTEAFGEELLGQLFVFDMTVDIGWFGFYLYCDSDELEENGLTGIIPTIHFKNVVFNVESEESELYYVLADTPGSVVFDNVILNAPEQLFEIEIRNYYAQLQDNDRIFQIKNSDFSNLTVMVGGDYPNGLRPKVYIDNTKLKKIISYYSDINIDCNSTFVDGISKGRGEEADPSLLDYSIYEAYDGFYEDSYGKVTTSVCQSKSIDIKAKTSLDSIKEEYGFDIDDSWEIDDEEVIKIEDGKIIPLKVGTARLTKEIDGEIQVLIITVTKKALVNPATGRFYLIFVFTSVLLFLSFVINRKKRCI